MTTATTTASGKTVRIRAARVGQNFGYEGQVLAGNNRVIATVSEPRATREAAIEAARDLAARL